MRCCLFINYIYGIVDLSLYLIIIWMLHYFSSLFHYPSLTPHNFTVAHHILCSTFHNSFYVFSCALFLPYKPLCISHDFDWTVHYIMHSLHATISLSHYHCSVLHHSTYVVIKSIYFTNATRGSFIASLTAVTMAGAYIPENLTA